MLLLLFLPRQSLLCLAPIFLRRSLLCLVPILLCRSLLCRPGLFRLFPVPFYAYGGAVAQRQNRRLQKGIVLQLIQVFPHSRVNGPVPPLHREAGLYHIPVLHHIVGDKTAPLRKKPQHMGQIVDVLAFGRIHKDEVVSSFQLFQHFCRVSLDQRDHVFLPCPCEITAGNGNPLFIILNCCNSALIRCVFTHQ